MSVRKVELDTTGWKTFETFLLALDIVGVPYEVEEKAERHFRGTRIYECPAAFSHDIYPWECNCPGHQHLRMEKFTVKGVPYVVEEYLSLHSCDPHYLSVIGIEVYKEGERPPLEDRVEYLEP